MGTDRDWIVLEPQEPFKCPELLVKSVDTLFGGNLKDKLLTICTLSGELMYGVRSSLCDNLVTSGAITSGSIASGQVATYHIPKSEPENKWIELES